MGEVRFSVSPCFTVELAICMLRPATTCKPFESFRLAFPFLCFLLAKLQSCCVGVILLPAGKQSENFCPCPLFVAQTLTINSSRVNRHTAVSLHPIAWRNTMLLQWFSVVCLSTLPHVHTAAKSCKPLASLNVSKQFVQRCLSKARCPALFQKRNGTMTFCNAGFRQ